MATPGTGVAFTEEEIAAALRHFETLPSYKDGSISTAEMPDLFRLMKWERSPAQLAVCIESINRINDQQRFEVEVFRRYLPTCHDPALMMREWAVSFDKDKDGFIDAEEYEALYEWLPVHIPGAEPPPFDKFLLEADSNKDGKVSIDEFTAYFAKIKK